MTLRQLVDLSVSRLCGARLDNPRGDAVEIIKKAARLNETRFLLSQNDDCSPDIINAVENMVSQRLSGEPIQYILGEWTFCGLDFKVGKGVLIPRPETEFIVYKALDIIKNIDSPIVLDLCTGSGCIGISIAVNNLNCRVYIADAFDSALDYAKENVLLNKAENVNVIKYDIFDGFSPEVFPAPDIIVSNPPYIPASEMSSLQTEVHFEPESALNGGADGLDFYRCLADKWLPYINEDGAFIFESGEDQPHVICSMINGFSKVDIQTDIFSVERFVVGYK